MRRFLAGTALGLAIGLTLTVKADSDDIAAVAAEAGIDAVALAGAVNTTHLAPRAYLEMVGTLARPAPVLSGRLACIVRVESRGDPNATNPRSGAGGLFQFLSSTWNTTPQGKAGLSRYDPVAATAAAEWMIGQGRIREWVAVSGGYC